jgi:Fuc2NAc and GlcNAc transferase
LLVALAGGGALIAGVGFVDDRRPLSPALRLVIHLAAALWTLAWLGGLPPFAFGDRVIELGWAGYVLGSLAIVWALNLFNFMDGIDGIAGSEAIFVAFAGATLGVTHADSSGVAAVAVVLGAACCGFLLWNFPMARIFMGDAGSGYLGYAIAVLAIAATDGSPQSLIIWLILGGVFFVDATVTFVRRLLRREPLHQAHRTHAYQWLARRWRSHVRVTLLVLGINLLWFLPFAILATWFPSMADWILVIAFAPIAFGAMAAGAGRAES